MPRFDPSIICKQIDNLLIQFPELQEDEVLRADMLEGSTDLNAFLIQVERQRRDATTLADAIGIYVDELRSRKARFERRDEAFRSLMFKLLEWANLKKVELAEATISIRQGTPKVIVTDESMVPDIFCRFKREVDKVKVKEALAAGKKVKGAELSNAESTLAIRTK